jgi:hypothetical protein
MESALDMSEEKDHTDGALLQDTRTRQNSRQRGTHSDTGTTKQYIVPRYEGIAIAAVTSLGTKERPFACLRKIAQHARDHEKDLSHT